MSNTMTTRKLLAVLLAVAVAITMIPSLSFAAEGGASDVKYVKMNVPYTDFYAAYNLTDAAVWTQDDGVDGVSTATTSKFAGTTGLANGTYNNGTYIKGVSIPVAVDAATYGTLANKVDDESALATAPDYAFADLAEAPEYYSTLTVADGKYSFSAMQETSINTSYLAVGDLRDEPDNRMNPTDEDFNIGDVDLDDGYGDYQVTLKGLSNKDRSVKVGEKETLPCTVYGAILKTTEGKTFGMTALENLWFGTKRAFVEIAFSVPTGQQLARGHGKGGLFYQFNDLNGKTLSDVILITNQGIIDIPCYDKDGTTPGLNLPPYFEGDLSQLTYSITAGSKELKISGIPAELKDVTVSMSNMGPAVQVVDGVATFRKPAADGVSYTLTISSSNYFDITRSVSTPISDAQKDELQALSEQAAKTEGYDANKDLQEHVQEAADLIAKADATSAEAAELIGELEEKIKNTYPAFELASASLQGTSLEVTLKDIALSDLQNPKYSLSASAGRGGVTVLAEGDLSALAVTLSKQPVAGTEYTLTITSDNYRDVTTKIAAAITVDQKAQLQDLTAQAKATTGYADNAALAKLVADAEAAIADASASSVTAASLIKDLQTGIVATYPVAKVTDLKLVGSTLTITLDTDLSALQNAAYDLGIPAFHGAGGVTLAKGALTDLVITTSEAPIAGTDYTLNITSDNYQPITATVTAEDAPAVTALDAAVVTPAKASYTYTGKALQPAVKVVLDGAEVDPAGYTVAYANNTKAGKATITVTGHDAYTGTATATFTIAKAANTVKVSTKTVTVKAAKVKKAAQKVAASKAFKVTKAQGSVTYKKASGNKKITIASNGKITVKKGLKKGTYKVKVTIKAKGNANYAAKSVSKTISVKVK